LPIRELICFPHESYPIFIGRAKSIKAVSAAEAAQGSILLVAQKDGKIAAPSSADMYAVGTLGVLVKLVRLSDGTVKALIEGKKRARVAQYAFDREFFEAEAEEIQEPSDRSGAVEALMQSVLAAFDTYAQRTARISSEAAKLAASIGDPSILSDKIVGHLKITLEEKQALLESASPVDRLEKILRHMHAAN
jgi:ATP-dependent Lon protease